MSISAVHLSRTPVPDISRLPPEMLVEIFNHVRQKQRRKLRSVCRYWSFLVEAIYQTPLWINSDNWQKLIRTSAQKLYVVIHNLDYRLNATPVGITFCIKLRKLELIGITLCSNFILVLQKCQSLEKLKIYMANFRTHHTVTRSSIMTSVPVQFQRTSDEVQAWLPNLRRLEIRMKKDNEDNFAMFELLCKVARNRGLVTFCLTMDSYIGDFRFVPWFGDPVPSDFVYDGIVREILISNHSTLKTVVVERRRVHFPVLAGTYDHKKCFGVWTYPRRHSFNGVPYLRTIEAMDIFFEPDGELRHPWSKIIQQKQTEYLRTLRLAFQDPASQLPKIQMLVNSLISSNPNMLVRVTLQMRILNPTGPVWNLAIFSHCKSLKTLGLWHNRIRSSTNVYASGSFHSISGIDKLPSSLKYFRTSFTILSQCASFREMEFANLGNLETLEIISTPWFILNGEPKKTLGMRHLNHMKSRLPALKKLFVRMETYHSLQEDESWIFNVSTNLRQFLHEAKAKYFKRDRYYRFTIDMSNYDPIQVQ